MVLPAVWAVVVAVILFVRSRDAQVEVNVEINVNADVEEERVLLVVGRAALILLWANRFGR